MGGHRPDRGTQICSQPGLNRRRRPGFDAAEAHPASVMVRSCANQALASEYLLTNRVNLVNRQLGT